MYFIRCENCGFENPLKTEYLTFCENCGRKLNENFTDWKKLHPEKDFEDFRKGHLRKNSSVSQTARRKINLRAILTSFLVSGVVVMIIALISFPGIFSNLFLPRTFPQRMLEQKWQRINCGKYGLSIVTPEKPEEDKVNISRAGNSKVQDFEAFSWQPSKYFRMYVMNVLYREGIPVNLNLVASATIIELINRPGISNVEYKQSPVFYNDVNGIMIEGSCHENEIFMRFSCILYIRKSNAWTVTVICPDSDPTGKEAGERLIESVEINYEDKII